MSQKVYDMLEARGYIAQVSHEELRDKLNNEKITFYLGIDMTGDSLTAGHFQTLMALKHLQEAGHKLILLIGGGTTLVPDPTGKNEMRQIMSPETIQKNAEGIMKQMEKFFQFGGEDGAIMVNNADWLTKLNYIDFLRTYGPYFSINRMLNMETYATRLDHGLTLLEFNYLPMQSYDFLHLYREYNCVMQCGGTDQWSNLLGGVDLIRRIENGQAYALTFNLLTTADGTKMGKSVAGAVWLDGERTSPYEFYQYWRNVEDVSVEMLLKRLTTKSLDEIAELTREGGQALNHAKEVLAWELTQMIHGVEEADKAKAASRALFSGQGALDDAPTSRMPDAIGREWLDILVELGLIQTKSEGRRLMKQNGLSLNDAKLTDPYAVAAEADFRQGYALLRKGKKVYHKVTLL
ncbi:MAG TPA: tyrosine--tRNA ligase [Tissierellia bacterium]|nr:tyrosine--tRNA ligase [Tissierellia bacterium]